MKRRYAAAFVVVGWMGALLATEGCKDDKEDDRTPSSNEAPTMTGANIVRGMMGLSLDPSAAAPSDAKGKAYEAAVSDLIAEIEAQFPGRLAQISDDLRSRDANRVLDAKARLDQTIATVASSAALRDRLAADPALGGGTLTRSAPGTWHTLGGPLTGDGGPLVSDGGSLSGDGGSLVCEQPRGADGQPLHLGRVNGRYGDDRSGALGAAQDTGDLIDTTDLLIWRTLNRIDRGELTPDPDSRLGAYAATRGYPVGTVGNAVHNGIGAVYLTFANYGQEKIGRVFNSPEARALYDKPVDSCAGAQMAMLEYQYWSDVRDEDSFSGGGRLGSAFNPAVRDLLQRRVFDR